MSLWYVQHAMFCAVVFVTGLHHSGTTIMQHTLLRSFNVSFSSRVPEQIPQCDCCALPVYKWPLHNMHRGPYSVRSVWPKVSGTRQIVVMHRPVEEVLWSVFKRKLHKGDNTTEYERFREWAAIERDRYCAVEAFLRNQNVQIVEFADFVNNPKQMVESLGLPYVEGGNNAQSMPESKFHEKRRQWQSQHSIYQPDDVPAEVKTMGLAC